MAIVTFVMTDTDSGAVDIKVKSNIPMPKDIEDLTPAQQCAIALRQIVEDSMKPVDEEPVEDVKVD